MGDVPRTNHEVFVRALAQFTSAIESIECPLREFYEFCVEAREILDTMAQAAREELGEVQF